MVLKSIRKQIASSIGKVRGAYTEPGKVKVEGVTRLGSPGSPHPAIYDIRRATRVFLLVLLFLTSMLAVASYGVDRRWAASEEAQDLAPNRVEVGMVITILSEFDSSPEVVDCARPKKAKNTSSLHA